MQTKAFKVFLEGFSPHHFIFRDLSLDEYILLCHEAEQKYSDLDAAYNIDKGKSLLQILSKLSSVDNYMLHSVSCYFDFSSYQIMRAKQMGDIEKINLEKQIQDIENSAPTISGEEQMLIHSCFEKKFKSKLFELWGGCSVTGYKNLKLLVVTLIKPYNECSLTEKFDIYNVLLLTPTYSKLFEECLISFDNLGRILIDESLTYDDQMKLGVSRKDRLRVEKLTLNHSYYLEHHRHRFLCDLAVN